MYSETVARRCSEKKRVLKGFAKFTGKQLYQSLFFNEVSCRPVRVLFFNKVAVLLGSLFNKVAGLKKTF